jgi:hypothetical protein
VRYRSCNISSTSIHPLGTQMDRTGEMATVWNKMVWPSLTQHSRHSSFDIFHLTFSGLKPDSPGRGKLSSV